MYPDYKWLLWKFPQVPGNFWADRNNKRLFLDWAAEQLNIKEPYEWSKVTNEVTLPNIK